MYKHCQTKPQKFALWCSIPFSPNLQPSGVPKSLTSHLTKLVTGTKHGQIFWVRIGKSLKLIQCGSMLQELEGKCWWKPNSTLNLIRFEVRARHGRKIFSFFFSIHVVPTALIESQRPHSVWYNSKRVSIFVLLKIWSGSIRCERLMSSNCTKCRLPLYTCQLY